MRKWFWSGTYIHYPLNPQIVLGHLFCLLVYFCLPVLSSVLVKALLLTYAEKLVNNSQATWYKMCLLGDCDDQMNKLDSGPGAWDVEWPLVWSLRSKCICSGNRCKITTKRHILQMPCRHVLSANIQGFLTILNTVEIIGRKSFYRRWKQTWGTVA